MSSCLCVATGSGDSHTPAAALFSHQPGAADDSNDLTEEEKAAVCTHSLASYALRIYVHTCVVLSVALPFC